MTRGKRSILAALVFVAIFLTKNAAIANTQGNFSNVCEKAAVKASFETGVPVDVLRAITLTETGRTRDGVWESWPWTVNMEGTGRWFNSRSEALDYIRNHARRGSLSFDVGCFQVNYKWHGMAFRSVDHMFDPAENALYAARFLLQLFDEFGDWTSAAGAYHSRTPKFANRYKERFTRILGQLRPLPRVAQREPVPDRVNSFPFLRPVNSIASSASLVPLQTSAPKRLIDIAEQ